MAFQRLEFLAKNNFDKILAYLPPLDNLLSGK